MDQYFTQSHTYTYTSASAHTHTHWNHSSPSAYNQWLYALASRDVPLFGRFGFCIRQKSMFSIRVYFSRFHSRSASAYFQRMDDVGATSCRHLFLAFVLHLMTSATGYYFWSSYRQYFVCAFFLRLLLLLLCCPLLLTALDFMLLSLSLSVSVIRPLIWRCWLSVGLLLTHFKYINRTKTHVPSNISYGGFSGGRERERESHSQHSGIFSAFLQQYVLLIIGII